MNLLEINDTALVEKTDLSRKLTLGGRTRAYPVYRVRLDQIFYNDRNDRIATWITQYKNDNGELSYDKMNREEYNGIIEKFIIESNPAAIEKTKNNIALVNQREPGVVLSDGRIIDGNRRFTCLRLINKNDPSVNYFETVILEPGVEDNQKQIKMLELAIQHGEEQRVDYDLIDLAIGAYHDVVETELLTVEEYAESTNEQVAEVRKRIETAKLIIEFLEFMNVPKQYHIARQMSVYSVFSEMLSLLRKCDKEEAEDLKKSVFSNVMMGSFADHRKYIRNVKSMQETGFFSSYMREQKKITETIVKKKTEANIIDKESLRQFVKENTDTAEDLQFSLDKALLNSKKQQTKSRPAQIVNKSVSMLMDIDTRIIDKLSDSEKDRLKNQLNKLTSAVSLIKGEVDDEETIIEETEELTGKILAARRHKEEPLVYCLNEDHVITNLTFSLIFSAFTTNDKQKKEANYIAFFVNEKHEELCPLKEFSVVEGKNEKVSFTLNAGASNEKECYLVLKSSLDTAGEAQQLIPFKINISFSVDFDF